MKRFHILTDKQLNKLIEEKSQEMMTKKMQAYEIDRLSKEIYMQALQNQINPHFLYNTLECIRGQALLKDEDEIAETVGILSRFFRYSLSSRDSVVTLRDELNNLTDYLKIQQYRFKDRYSLVIDLPENDPLLPDTSLPKLTLQPIVENSIKYAFHDQLKNNRITVRIRSSEQHISITISDNGKGIESSTLYQLNERLKDSNWVIPDQASQNNTLGNGIALHNINRRLKLYFGEKYGLAISSILGIGTDVEIHIPRYKIKT